MPFQTRKPPGAAPPSTLASVPLSPSSFLFPQRRSWSLPNANTCIPDDDERAAQKRKEDRYRGDLCTLFLKNLSRSEGQLPPCFLRLFLLLLFIRSRSELVRLKAHTHTRAGKKHKRSQTWVGRCRLPSDGLNAKQRLVRPCAAVMGRDSIDIASVRARPTRNLRVATAATRWDSAPSLSPENS